jgi:uncharacterized protein YyaL (SSP411 family)
MKALLGSQAEAVMTYFGVEADGNVENDPHAEFTGRNILYVADPRLDAPSAAATGVLFQARAGRPRPHLDSKILTAWNSQMISALCTGYLVLGEDEYLMAARRCFDFLISKLFAQDKHQLWRRYCEGEAAVTGFLDDYAFLAQAGVALFEASGRTEYLETAVMLVRQIVDRFEDPSGGFFSTEASAGDLLLRMKDDYDGAEPSGNSVATEVFLQLSHLLGEDWLSAHAMSALSAASAKIKAQPTMAPQMLCALALSFSPPEHYVVRVRDEYAAASPEVQALLQQQRRPFKPFLSAFALTDQAAASLKELSPFLAALTREGHITVYHCQEFVCRLPQVIE